MNRSVNIRPCADGIGYALEFGSQFLWFGEEVHAINYVQDRCGDSDVLVYDAAGDLIRHYVAAQPGVGEMPADDREQQGV